MSKSAKPERDSPRGALPDRLEPDRLEHRFQVNLGGIIDLLSNHLYGSPNVYVRELLQNGIDAIRARQREGVADFDGQIDVEIAGVTAGGQPTILLSDNGVGLDRQEIHRFLATIGESSKRGDWELRRHDYLGQFGIGLLSCFIVADEIVVITHSAKSDATQSFEWRGRADGTYSLREIHTDSPRIGTRVFLRCKPGSEDLFAAERVVRLAAYYGEFLPIPIRFLDDSIAAARKINAEPAPWLVIEDDSAESRRATVCFGRRLLGSEPLDWIPLNDGEGTVGIAYVRGKPTSLADRATHRVYLKCMLVSESVDNLLPDWAFFVKCVVKTEHLRPTASREALYEDDQLARTRQALGDGVRAYLITLAHDMPEKLRQLIDVHYRAFKALAVEDDEFFELIVDHLPFETSDGRMTLGEYRRRQGEVLYTTSVDDFRQLARVATAQSISVINGGYAFDREVLERLPDFFDELEVRRLEASDLVNSFSPLSADEAECCEFFLDVARDALAPFSCSTRLRRFEPSELTALYASDEESDFHRSVALSRQVVDHHWTSIMDAISSQPSRARRAELCFNYSNPLVLRLTRLRNRRALELSVQMLYAQSLLLGHYPLKTDELELLNHGLTGLIEFAADDGADDAR